MRCRDGSKRNENEWKLAWLKKLNEKVNGFTIASLFMFIGAICGTMVLILDFGNNTSTSIFGIICGILWVVFLSIFSLSIAFQLILRSKLEEIKSVIKNFEK